MIPQLVTVRWQRRRLFIPVLPVVLLLSPLLVLVVLAGLVACLIFRISFVGALRGIARLVWALPGTRIDIDDGQTIMRIKVS